MVEVKLKREVNDSYDIQIGENLFPEVAEYLKQTQLGSRHAIVTDSNVRLFHAGDLETALKQQGLETEVFSFEAGESNKTEDNCTKIIIEMLDRGYGRDSVVLALGGGVVGDMAGYIAGKFNRGIPFVQIPTTFLAHADSSVGGKTGVDIVIGTGDNRRVLKNAVGLFNQPKRVYIDVATLKTLPNSEYRNGLAETIKHAVIRETDFFDGLDEDMDFLIQRDPKVYLETARMNCQIKAEVVQIDPNEKGLRRILNYGHTVGHAIESLSDFRLSHGECVSIGMMVAGRISRDLGYFPDRHLERQERLLRKAGLPVIIPINISNEDILALTLKDKKAKGGKARYCLPMEIGKMHSFDGAYATYVDKEVILKALENTR